MKYILRSIKYFFCFCFVYLIFICLVVLFTEGMTIDKIFDPEVGMFRAGALWQTIIFFGAIAAIYPAISFVKKQAFINGTFEENRDVILSVLDGYGYYIVSEDDEIITIRIKQPFTRLMRLYEDTVTITKGESPLTIIGMRKDVMRLSSGIEYAARDKNA